jgi:PGF-pre-PGF domain-containing protein
LQDSDCETNKCLGFKCAEEWRECWSNYDCKFGYCKDGKCVLPNVEIYELWESRKIKIREIKPNSRLDINMSNFPIRNISIYSRVELKNVEINIDSLYDWKIERIKIEKPTGEVYKYFNITIENATFYDIDRIEIEFNVEKSWISRFNIDEISIRLLRYYENKWNELKTWKVSEDEYNFYYRAQTPFFSIFAIVGITKLQQPEKSSLPLSKELQGESIQQQEGILSKEESQTELTNTTKSQQPENSTLRPLEESQRERIREVEKETPTITIQPQKESTSSEEGIHTVLVLFVVFIITIVIGLGYIISRKFKQIRERKNDVTYRIKHKF